MRLHPQDLSGNERYACNQQVQHVQHEIVPASALKPGSHGYVVLDS